jgi:hypothetical protein
MAQYTEEYEDIDSEFLDDIDVEEDDDDDDDGEELFESFTEEDDDDDDEEEYDEPEDFGEGYDDDDDGESLAERRYRWRRRRRFPIFRRRRFRRRYRRPRRYRPVRSIRRAVIRTPAGRAQVRLPKAVPTRASVNARLKEIKREIDRNAKAIKKVDATIEKNTGIVDKKVSAVSADLRRANKRMRERLQQAMLLPLLLQSKPRLDTVRVQPVDARGRAIDGRNPETFKLSEHKFQSDDNNLLPLVLLMGGMGGGGSSSNMLILALALSGGLGSKN